MRVLITGANGQLGQALQNTRPASLEILAFGREQLDLADPALPAGSAVLRLAVSRRPASVADCVGDGNVADPQDCEADAFHAERRRRSPGGHGHSR